MPSFPCFLVELEVVQKETMVSSTVLYVDDLVTYSEGHHLLQGCPFDSNPNAFITLINQYSKRCGKVISFLYMFFFFIIIILFYMFFSFLKIDFFFFYFF
jgi:hypothetical protein